jgi:hypothetical protein
MKPLAAVIGCWMILCMPLNIVAGDKMPPFRGTGVWNLDLIDSDIYAKRTTNYDGAISVDRSTAQSGPLVIEQSGDSIRITDSKGGNTTIYSYKYGESNEVVEIPAQGNTMKAQRETKTKWTKNKVEIVETIPDHPEGKKTTEKSFVLSKDGKRLTVKVETTLKKT